MTSRAIDEHGASSNDIDLKSLVESAEAGSSAPSQERLEEVSKKISESTDLKNRIDAASETSVAPVDETTASPATPITSSSKKARQSFKYDPNKITLRFLFANRDGLAVTIECNPSDTVGEVKGALILAWPEGMYW